MNNHIVFDASNILIHSITFDHMYLSSVLVDCSNDGVAKIISCNYTKTTSILHNPTWKVNGSDVESRDYTTSIELNSTHYITNLNYSSFPVGVHKVALKYNLKGPIVVCEDIAVRYTATVVIAGNILNTIAYG